MNQNNPYVRFYLNQQQGQGMPVFKGSAWQVGHGQIGYGLGGLFRSVARSVMPMAKIGARALGNVALKSGANFLGDILAGKNVKESAKARANEAASTAKKTAIDKLQSMTQTGNGKRARQKGKKRKSSQPAARIKQNKKRKTTKEAEDIFG